MIKFTQSDYVDIDKYEDHIRYNGYITCDMERMSNIYYFNSTRSDSLAALARDVMKYHSGAIYHDLQREAIYRYLTRYENCPDHYFYKKNVQGISIDAKKVLEKLQQNGYAREFLSYYIESRSVSSKCSKVKTLMDECRTIAGYDRAGKPLTRIPYDVNQQQNLRYNYKNYDVIGIPKEYATTIGVEDGYLLAWGDFAQSDFRIAFNLLLRDEANTKFMSEIDDKYEGLARLIALNNKSKFNKEEFLKMRKTYKTMTLATMYGTRNSVVKEEKDFITMLSKYLSECPKYAEFQKRIEDKIELGLAFTLDSYFGHQEWIPILNKPADTLHKALNTPIQSGTSEIVILVVNKILDMFYALGYTEDDISVFIVRHDEPVFKMKEHVLKDAWIFNEVSKIIVDNWVPLELDFSFGSYYKVEDEYYTELAKKSYNDNLDKITYIEQDTKVRSEYYPIKPVAHLAIYAKDFIYEGIEKIAFVYYSPDLNVFDFRVLSSRKDDIIYSSLMNYINNFEELIIGDYSGMLVYTNILEKEFCFKDRTYAKISKCTNELVGNAQKILEYYMYKFFGLNESNQDIKEYEPFINTLKRVDLKETGK